MRCAKIRLRASSASATPANIATSGKRAQPEARESESDTAFWIAAGKLARKDVASYPTYTYNAQNGNGDRVALFDKRDRLAVPCRHRRRARRLEHGRAGPRRRRLREARDAGGGARARRRAARARARGRDDTRPRRVPDLAR